MQFYGVNLNGGENTELALDFYQKAFSGTVLARSVPHSELSLWGEIRLIFSRPTRDCPVGPGTLTIKAPKDLSWESKGFEKGTEGKSYSSYLDPWGNRLWVYYD